MAILTAQHICKSYGKLGYQSHVLDDASIQVNEGEFVTILGPSGSGKSTLLNICGLVETLDGGELFHQKTRLDLFTEAQRTVKALLS